MHEPFPHSNLSSNPYACLGLMPGSSQADIKRRYRQLAKQYHPDRNGHSANSEEKLRDLNAAYEFLSDPARKAAYDASRAAAFPVTGFQPARVPQTAPFVLHIPRQRSRSRRAFIGLTLLMLLSTGAGVLFNAVNHLPALPNLFGTASSKAADAPPAPPYSFLPSKGPFDDSGSSAPPVSDQTPAPTEDSPP